MEKYRKFLGCNGGALVITTINEQQVDVDRQSSREWFGDDVSEDIWKSRFTYGIMTNMAKN